MNRMASLVAALTVTLLGYACQQAQPPDEEDAARRSDTIGGAQAGATRDSVVHEQEEEDEPPPLMSREQDSARDAGEKPEQVMDELGISADDRVADVLAGGGYYTYLLSERVGSGGMVYATGAEGVERRLNEGDLRGKQNVRVVESLSEIPAGALDAVLINRAYHLVNKQDFLRDLRRAMKPGGVVGIIEVRLGRPRGHDMKTHRMGEDTVREEMEQAGFAFAGSSDILRSPDDPHTDFMEGKRHLADRMFLKFEKPDEEVTPRQAAASQRSQG